MLKRCISHVRQNRFQGSLEKTAIHLFSGAADTGNWDNHCYDLNFLFGSSKAGFDYVDIGPGFGSTSRCGCIHLDEDVLIKRDFNQIFFDGRT